MDLKADLPTGFVFLKRKNAFEKGRTIISYAASPFRKLLQAASQAIMLMLRFTWGNSLGLQPTPQLWSDLRDFLQRTSREVHLDEINDDLGGFVQLSSPPQVLLSLQALVHQYLP